ncbi:hypothetical protein B0H14DRAFT_2565481 [Mycena olivaceomarginata]|nr:hypothetical protein B0H14DRAFT_2565481 [Mycena olivaceomarginata]
MELKIFKLRAQPFGVSRVVPAPAYGNWLAQCVATPLLRDFQPTWQKVQDSVAPSGEQVASGEAPATALRAKNRKIEDTDNGRTAIPGITVPLVSDSQGESSRPPGTQRTLDAAWRSSKITVVPQCPAYSVPDRSSFISSNLVTETEHAMKQLQELLESFIHLTMSFDGWSSRRNDEIYTVHVSTPTRMSYLVAGIILTGISTAGEIIFGHLKDVSFLSSFL